MSIRSTLLLSISLVLSMAAEAYAESYREWLQYPKQAPSSLQIEAELFDTANERIPISDSPSSYKARLDKLFSSKGDDSRVGYLGALHLTQTTAAQPVALPITVELLYNRLTADDLEGKPPHPSLTTRLPLDDKIPPLAHREVFTRSSLSSSIPLLLPDLSKQGGRYSHDILHSLRLRIIDAKGRELARHLLIDFFKSHRVRRKSTAWIPSGLEDSGTPLGLNGIEDKVEVQAMPSDLSPYQALTALWLPDGQSFESSFLRKLILKGVWIYGSEDNAQRVAKQLGLRETSAVLLGGIEDGSRASYRLLQAVRGASFYSHSPFVLSDDSRRVFSSTHPFENYSSAYEFSTALFLGSYSLLILLGAPFLFGYLKGANRVKIWLLIPGLALLISILSWGTGEYLLPRKTVADVVEFRFSYGDWPEVYIHDVIQVLSMKGNPEEFKVSGAAQAQMRKSSSNARRFATTGKPFQSIRHENKIGEKITNFGFDYQTRGSISTHEIFQFKTIEKPLSLVKQDNSVFLKAETNVKKLYVWDNEKLLILGAHAAGAIIDPQQGKEKHYGAYTWIPSPLARLFAFGKKFSLNSKQFRTLEDKLEGTASDKELIINQLKDGIHNSGLFPNHLVVVAVTEESAHVVVDPDQIALNSEVIWFQQIPLHEVPTNVETGSDAQ